MELHPLSNELSKNRVQRAFTSIKPFLAEKEYIILCEEGLINLLYSWTPGHLCLTNKRLLFFKIQGYKGIDIRFQVFLDKIIDVIVEERRFMLGGKRKALFVSFEAEPGKILTQCLPISDPIKWKEAILEKSIERDKK